MKTVNFIECKEFNELVESHYGKHYDLSQQCEYKKGLVTLTVPVENPEDFEVSDIDNVYMGVKFETWLNTSVESTKDDFKYPYLFWCKKFYPSLGMVVNDLNSKGLLKAGEYIIHLD